MSSTSASWKVWPPGTLADADAWLPSCTITPGLMWKPPPNGNQSR
jgi:hypothetical protein